MKETFLNIKNQIARRFKKQEDELQDENLDARPEYVELSHEGSDEERKKAKIKIQQFTIADFEDVKPILDSLRKGATIALINIQPLKEKDIIELKRAINKLKKTCDAIDGDLAGFGEDYVVATPEFAYISRGSGSSAPSPAAPAGAGSQESSDGFDE